MCQLAKEPGKAYEAITLPEADAEAERYNLYASFFNIAYGEYAAWYNRTASLPRRGGWRY
jgi:hypothetical protein